MSHRILRLLAVMLTLALIVAACGGGGRDDDSSAGDTDTTTAADGSSDTTGEAPAEPIIDTSECPEADPAIGIEGDTIKFGTSLPQSGLYSGFKEILRGEAAYFKYMNDELGGVDIAGKKYKVELVAKDDAYDSAKTVTNVDELIANDEVFALFNVVGTKNNLAIRDTVNEDCVPNLFPATGSPVWGNHAYPWIVGSPLVPYPLEMQALVDYLKESKPAAKIAVLRANDDFGLSYIETLKALIEGTDLTIAQEETYDPEGADVATQVTSLAATNADVFVIGGTLLACPASLTAMAAAGWKPIVYMSGTCTSKTLMVAAKENGEGVLSVASLMDPSDPQFASNEAVTLYKEKIAVYGDGADATNSIVAYGWSVAALLEETLKQTKELTRAGVMEAARTLTDLKGIALQLPDSTWSVGADDWFLGEEFNLVQYSVAGAYFKPLGTLINDDDKTEEITPEELINK